MLKSRIIRQLGSRQAPNIADIRATIAEIKKIVVKLYERSVVPEPIIESMIPTIEISNSWTKPVDV